MHSLLAKKRNTSVSHFKRIPTKMEKFETKIQEYKDHKFISSPVWIFFERTSHKDQNRCLICNKTIKCKQSSTTGLNKHIQVSHGAYTKFNASAILTEMFDIKDKRQSRKKEAEGAGGR